MQMHQDFVTNNLAESHMSALYDSKVCATARESRYTETSHISFCGVQEAMYVSSASLRVGLGPSTQRTPILPVAKRVLGGNGSYLGQITTRRRVANLSLEHTFVL